MAELADAVVNTARFGAVKPDPAVYRVAVAGAHPARCPFVDDTESHLAFALVRELGMRVPHYRAPEWPRDALDSVVSPALGSFRRG